MTCPTCGADLARRALLADLEVRLGRSLGELRRAGAVLRLIDRDDLWRVAAGATSFEAYCARWWGLSPGDVATLMVLNDPSSSPSDRGAASIEGNR